MADENHKSEDKQNHGHKEKNTRLNTTQRIKILSNTNPIKFFKINNRVNLIFKDILV